MDDWKNTVNCIKKYWKNPNIVTYFYWKNPITGGLNYV